jgi:phosphoglycolate phosphatase
LSVNNATLILFDIDGTLLSAHGAGLQALEEALSSVFGIVSQLKPHQLAGNLDPLIYAAALADLPAGSVPDPQARYALFRESYLRNLAAKPSRQFTACAGVKPFLEAHCERFVFGLITGNIREGAFIKLKNCGLETFFTDGGFGEDGPDRNAVAAHALAVMTRRQGHPFKKIVMIGDTQADVTCGRHIGAYTIAVRTGYCRWDGSEAIGADRTVDTLSEVVLD